MPQASSAASPPLSGEDPMDYPDGSQQNDALVRSLKQLGTLYASASPTAQPAMRNLQHALERGQLDRVETFVAELVRLGKEREHTGVDPGMQFAIQQLIQQLQCSDSQRKNFMSRLSSQQGIFEVIASLGTVQLVQNDTEEALDIDQLRPALQKALLSILDTFDIHDTLAARHQLLRESITRCWPLATLPDLLQDTVSFIYDCNQEQKNERAKIEGFLLQFTQELSAIEGYVRHSQDDVRTARFRNSTINQQVDGEIDNIASDLDEAIDISDLRDRVSTRLENVRQSMQRFSRTESTRLSLSEQRNRELERKLKSLESETLSLRVRLDDTNKQLLVDTLTGIANRFAYEQRFQELHGQIASTGSSLCYALMDIDFFKRINDQYGHKAGDRVLALIANLIHNSVRSHDFFARIGGEEFALLMPDTDLETAQTLCESIRQCVAESGFNHRGKAVGISISIGLTLMNGIDQRDDIYERADKALYAAKEGGRDRVVTS